MGEAAQHARDVNKAKQDNSKKVGCNQNPINYSEPFLCPLAPFPGKMMLSLDV
jgi:hypothetical protein